MIRPPYIAWLSKRGSFSDAERTRFASDAASCALPYARIGTGIILASAGAKVRQSCAVVGTAFATSNQAPLVMDHLESRTAVADALQRLLEHYWGNYIAFEALAGSNDRCALRAPFGDLPCYWHEAANHVVLSSSIELLARFGAGKLVVDWNAMSDFLAATDLRTGRTCLDKIRELGGGELLRVSASGVRIEQRWSPWAWTDPARQFATREDAAGALRSAIDGVIAARIPPDMTSVVLLSGGLDSSVVAAALAGGRRRFTCLTMTFDDVQGDEREYARAAALHLGAPLVEVRRDPGCVDLARPLSAQPPRPTGAQFRQATLSAADALVQEIGAGLVIDGGGGDNMFCSLQSAAPVIDELLAKGPVRDVLVTAASVARLANVSVPAVLRRAIIRILTRRRIYRWPFDNSLLSPTMLADCAPSHPWLAPPPGVPPGKAAQVALLLAATAASEGPDPERRPEILSPLVAQPISEVVLRVPAWMWFEEGRNRTILRRAFAHRLPASVIGRRSKGTPAGFLAALVETGVDSLRPFLLDGRLAAHGVIDRAAVAAALAGGPAQDLLFARLLQLADAEAWARSWD